MKLTSKSTIKRLATVDPCWAAERIQALEKVLEAARPVPPTIYDDCDSTMDQFRAAQALDEAIREADALKETRCRPTE